MYDELVKLISNLGFPVAVSIYLLVKLDKRLEELTKAFLKFSNILLSVMEHREEER
ncbi:YvrJ family protein [Clostridium sp. MSJ-11]|uniref:YvrJ family protein n=1 Tax=Clostridium mobile TaxID=2841512 RepID=A0ABS6EIC4_9CLOT|nr:YvrJ family protein [Clostridium mobile]MBU5484149.1 YvrJ family protein [Clostridium mobile]